MAATRGPFIIASGQTVSGAVDLGIVNYNFRLIGLVFPAAFTGANVTFQVSADDVTYQPLHNSTDAALTVTVSAGNSYSFKQDEVALIGSWRFMKLVSASPEGAQRTITPLVN
jgi:hypothetical protein